MALVFVVHVAAAPFGMAHAKAARLFMVGPLFESVVSFIGVDEEGPPFKAEKSEDENEKT